MRFSFCNNGQAWQTTNHDVKQKDEKAKNWASKAACCFTQTHNRNTVYLNGVFTREVWEKSAMLLTLILHRESDLS